MNLIQEIFFKEEFVASDSVVFNVLKESFILQVSIVSLLIKYKISFFAAIVYLRQLLGVELEVT